VGYVHISRLGRGGMGVVDLARGPDGTEVALKRLTLHGSAEEMARARQRLEREGEVLARLDHPNIVGLVEVLDDGGEVVLVMPYLTGGTLADRVRGHGPAPAEEVERLGAALLGALAAAHRAGVVHRDIKPANVLFDDAGSPHLADFGVASSRHATPGLTIDGTVVGTPGFMAPEQARGEDAGQASDVFSLGATLLFAATGHGPYGTGEPGLLMVRAASGKVERLPRDLAPSLRALIEPMLEPRPERRPSAAALAGGVDGTIAFQRLGGRRQRRRALAVVGAGLAIALVALAAIGVGRDDSDGGAIGPPGTTATTTTPCAPRTYQPCGEAIAPFTDGDRCIDGHDDYDADASNGCEAVPDDLDGTELIDRLEATIVPRDDTDSFTMHVSDGAQLLCDGKLHVTLTAPAGASLRLDLLRDGKVLETATSADGTPQTATVQERSCVIDDSATLEARVTPIGSDRSAQPYTLERDGSF
jgi:hypothetical protein